MLTKSEIVNKLKKLGIFNGDTVLVHSSFKSLGEVEGSMPDPIIPWITQIQQRGFSFKAPDFGRTVR